MPSRQESLELIVFVPYADAAKCAASLEMKRLNAMRREPYVVLTFLMSPNRGYKGLGVCKAWTGHERFLAELNLAYVAEWVGRGYRDNVFELRIKERLPRLEDTGPPVWWGDERIHHSHRRALVAKAPDHYAAVFSDIDPDETFERTGQAGWGYVWPGDLPESYTWTDRGWVKK